MWGPLRELLRLYRVRDWLHFLLLPLASFTVQPPLNEALLAAARGIAAAFTILAFGYLLNSVADRRMDLDQRKNPLIDPAVGDPRYSLVVLPVLSLVLVLFAPWQAQLATVVCLACYYVYSSGPRLKAIPVLGSLVNVGLFVPLLFVGMREVTPPPGFAYVILACGALVFETQLIHEAADQVEDRAGGVGTTWLALGPRRTAAMAAAAGFITIVAAWNVGARTPVMILVLALGAASCIVFPLLLARRGVDATDAARLRIAHRWCGVMYGAGLFALWRWGS